ncbi:MAG: transposase domain-containing protein [Spirochaetes bacterium]|nr:transposase domain-containing protein [Spirochaetota bacterium]
MRSFAFAEERSIKPFVVSRNWLFSGSPDGAESSCGFFSLIETAKENILNPQVYLYHVFKGASSISSPEEWEALLPWNVSLPRFLDAEYIIKGVSSQHSQ